MTRHSIEVRQAHISQVPAIAELIGGFAGRGEVLPRPVEDIYQSVREWVVACDGDRIVGCGSLVILWSDLAEIRSLIVSPEYQGMGIGRRMVTKLVEQAMSLGIPNVFALTRKPGFFSNVGFSQVPRASLPRKIWKDCVHCTNFVGCDEVAMLQELTVQTEIGRENSVSILAGVVA